MIWLFDAIAKAPAASALKFCDCRATAERMHERSARLFLQRLKMSSEDDVAALAAKFDDGIAALAKQCDCYAAEYAKHKAHLERMTCKAGADSNNLANNIKELSRRVLRNSARTAARTTACTTPIAGVTKAASSSASFERAPERYSGGLG